MSIAVFRREAFWGLYCFCATSMICGPKCKLSLYADNSALVYSGSDPAGVAAFLSSELNTCRKWLIDNRLSLHLGKTECILFGSRRRLAAGVDFEIGVGDTAVKRVTSVRYLGVVLDQCLDFSVHVKGILGKASGKLGFLYRNRNSLNRYTRGNGAFYAGPLFFLVWSIARHLGTQVCQRD